MDTENEQAQDEIVEQEEQILEEENNQEESIEETQDDSEDDNITLSKSEFTKLNRKAIAYDAGKKEKPLSKPNQEASISPDRLDRIELMQEGYSRDEVDTIMDLGGREKLDNPIVQNAIKVMRQQEKSKNASQNLPSKSPIFKKHTREDFDKMSSDEMEKVVRG
jgi:hypothetical protein